jgi:putative hydrolase of the HAD superfamily
MIQLVVFDLDNVLYSYDLETRICLLAKALRRPAIDVRARWLDSGWEAAAEAGAHPDGATYLREFNSLFGSELSVEAWSEIRGRAMAPNADALSLAARVKDKSAIAMLTNNGPLLREQLVSIAPQAAALFGAYAHASADFGARKPEADVFRRISQLHEASPEQILFIDDDVANIDGALKAGLEAHHFRNAVTLERFLADRSLI